MTLHRTGGDAALAVFESSLMGLGEDTPSVVEAVNVSKNSPFIPVRDIDSMATVCCRPAPRVRSPCDRFLPHT